MKNNESGQSLVLALSIMSVFMIFIVSISLFVRTDLQSSQKQIGQSNAYYIAEAGLQRAVQDINSSMVSGQTPATSYSDPNFRGGSYQVTIAPKQNGSGEYIGYTMDSTGTYKNETITISAWAREPLATADDLEALNYAIFGFSSINVQTVSALLATHKIQVNGNVHANGPITMANTGVLLTPPPPAISGNVSSTALSNIQVQGLNASKKVVRSAIGTPLFDFDRAREMAKKEGVYVNHNVSDISLLGLTPTKKIIFIDGNLSITGLDLLGISLQDRTFVVNGNFTGSLEVGGLSFCSTNLNIIAKQNITFTGAVTGLSVNGILFANGLNKLTNLPDATSGNISVQGHCAVSGYTGANKVIVGSGIISGLLGLITGDMVFTYDRAKIDRLQSQLGVGFKKWYIEIVDRKVVR